MSGLNELYQEVILDHNKRPRNFGPLATATHRANGHNPLCGDRLSLALQVEGDRITNILFEGSGCAISKASRPSCCPSWPRAGFTPVTTWPIWPWTSWSN